MKSFCHNTEHPWIREQSLWRTISNHNTLCTKQMRESYRFRFCIHLNRVYILRICCDMLGVLIWCFCQVLRIRIKFNLKLLPFATDDGAYTIQCLGTAIMDHLLNANRIISDYVVQLWKDRTIKDDGAIRNQFVHMEFDPFAI